MRKEILYPLRVLHGRLHEYAQQKKENRALCRELRRDGVRRAVLFATPLHTNLGDSAIVLAEQAFLDKCGITQWIEVTSAEYMKNQTVIDRSIRMDTLICWHGGGNMGDQWFSEEKLRRESLPKLSKNPVVVFPQTIWYTNTETGHREEAASVPVYNGKEKLVLAAREKPSYARMKALYDKASVLLVPDIVLSATAETFGVKLREQRSEVLLCMRNDAEKAVPDDLKERIAMMLKAFPCRYTDTHSDHWLTKETRAAAVREKMEEFSGAKLVVTDRLHGMVFAAITGTPCIVLSNYNHKVKGTYEWIKHLPYIRYVETAEEAEQILPELLSMERCVYDNSPLQPYFEELAEVIKNYAES